MALSRKQSDAVSVIGALVILTAIEAIVGFVGVRWVVIRPAVHFFPQWSGQSLFWLETGVAFTLIFGFGTWLGYGSVKYNLRSEAAEGSKVEGWLDKGQHKIALWFLRYIGGPLAFVAVSYLGGAFVIGWWYGRQHHPHAMAMATLSAFCLAATSAPAWVSGLNPQYRWLTPFVLIALPALGLLANLVWRLRRLHL